MMSLEDMEKEIGAEKAEEIEVDFEFLLKKFDEISYEAISSTVISLMSSRLDPIQALYSAFFNGMMVYREWLSEKGVDVRNWEGRND